MTRMNGGTVSSAGADQRAETCPSLSPRPARNAASTAIIRTFEISENWNCRPTIETQRWTPPMLDADRQRQQQQPDVHQVEQPREGAQPAVVEGGRET